MSIIGRIRVLVCVALFIALVGSIGSSPLNISAAVAGAGPEAAGDGDGTKKVKKRRGPPPWVHKEFLDVCRTCHKPDGRGGRSYGGYAANLHETELSKEGLVLIIEEGREENGMPAFKGILGKRTIDAVAQYIIDNFKGVPLDEAVRGHAGNPDYINE